MTEMTRLSVIGIQTYLELRIIQDQKVGTNTDKIYEVNFLEKRASKT